MRRQRIQPLEGYRQLADTHKSQCCLTLNFLVYWTERKDPPGVKSHG